MPKDLEDARAVGRILAIAEATPSPTWSLIRALKTYRGKHGQDTAWNNLFRHLDDLFNATDDDEAAYAIDECHDALQTLRDRDYSGAEWE